MVPLGFVIKGLLIHIAEFEVVEYLKANRKNIFLQECAFPTWGPMVYILGT